MKYTAYHEEHFRRLVQNALTSVKQILDVNRCPKVAEDEEHTYDDKYALAEFLTNTALASQMNVLERIGLMAENLGHLVQIVQQEKRSVTLCFEALDTCTFLKEQQVDVVQQGTERVVETGTSSFFGGTSTQHSSSKVVQKVREFHWKINVRYRIYCYEGSNPTGSVVQLQSRSASTTIVTTGPKQAPLPEKTVHDPIKVSLSWFLQNITRSEKQWICAFKIDRSKDTCCTPRRNDDTEAAIEFFHSIFGWSNGVRNFFLHRVERAIMGKNRPAAPSPQQNSSPSLGSLSDAQVFCPVVPLLEAPKKLAGSATREQAPRSLLVLPARDSNAPSPLLSLGDIDKLLNEQCRSMDQTLDNLGATFPSHQLVKLITVAEASLTLLTKVSITTFRNFQQCIGYVEEMLRKQVIEAVGKEVQPKDFNQFITFHNQKLFGAQYAPKPFCFAVRRPDHYPDGVLSLESLIESDKAEPINTHVRFLSGSEAPPMSISISASTSVSITGDRYLHGWVNHRFATVPKPTYQLTARARQFSSFLLVIGTLAGADKLIPKDAVIVQNKDEVIIPLLLKELPTAKEFKDAISSLSPEQQRFAKSYRGMQLESSVFGLCVIQLKPQLEILLGLPNGALTKEIRLTQNLMSLFLEYQIPSDLLSFDGSLDASRSHKVEQVKGHVKSVMEVIGDAKKNELEEMENRAKMNIASHVADYAEEESEEELDGAPEIAETPMLATSAPMLKGSSQVWRKASRGRVEKKAAAPPAVAMMSVQAGAARLRSAARSGRQEDAILESSISVPSNASPSEKDVEGRNALQTSEPSGSESDPSIDFTMIPKQLDAKFEVHDTDSALRSTILKTKTPWRRTRQIRLLSSPVDSTLEEDDCKSERNKAFDLLDALSRSGALPIACAEVHVIVAVTHCFENDVMGSVIQDNVNPIEKAEKSILMVASTVHGQEPHMLVKDKAQHDRLAGIFPSLLDAS